LLADLLELLPVRENKVKESILKASHSSAFLLAELKECYRKASPMEEIIVRQLLQNAVELEKRIQEFTGAVNAEGS
jgi:FMN-dependent NADH-azoreductase